MKKKERDPSYMYLPEGYLLEDYMDTDDFGYGFEDAILVEEVIVIYERLNEQ
jgi:hypothetical protein